MAARSLCCGNGTAALDLAVDRAWQSGVRGGAPERASDLVTRAAPGTGLSMSS